MFERFTDRARKVMALANQEAQRLTNQYIGTEHILLGLIKEGTGVGANVLKNLGVDLAACREEVEKLTGPGSGRVTMGKLARSTRAKKVIEYALEESKSLGHNYVGTEHLLLGLLRDKEASAAQALANMGLKLEEVRQEVLELLGAAGEGVELKAEAALPKAAARYPDLAEVTEAWGKLPQATRRAILAIVRDAKR